MSAIYDIYFAGIDSKIVQKGYGLIYKIPKERRKTDEAGSCNNKQ